MTIDPLQSDAADWAIPTMTVDEFFPRGTTYCICVPVINEGDRIRAQLDRMHPRGAVADVLVLDGGSTDGSTDPDFLRSRGVRALLTKMGTGRLSAQLRMGYAYALLQGYQGIVTVDGNNKDSVENIQDFLRLLDQGFDLVQGSRWIPGGQAINTPLYRFLTMRLIHAPLVSLGARYRYTDSTNGFRAYSRRCLLDSRVAPFRDIFATYELLAYLSVRVPRLGYKVTETPVGRAYPASGAAPTKITSLGAHTELLIILLNALIGRYDPPSRLASVAAKP